MFFRLTDTDNQTTRSLITADTSQLIEFDEKLKMKSTDMNIFFGEPMSSRG